MSIIRAILSFIILTFDKLFPPKGIQRSADRQAQVDQEIKALKVYEFEGCPFCVKVRREMKRLSLKIERKDVLKSETFKDELMKGGGDYQVPCLRIEESGQVRWLYESDAIISYLRQRFLTQV